MIRALAIPAFILLTGAGQASDGFSLTDASSQQVADAYAKARPGGPMHMGQWERTFAIETLELPGLPAGAARDAKIAEAKANSRTESVCHSGTDFAGPEPRAVFEMLGTDCRYAHMKMGGGSFDGSLTCNGLEDGKVAVAVSGTYDPNNFAIRYRIDMTPTDPAKHVIMTMLATGRRTGDCKS